jgi:hypothetical protein
LARGTLDHERQKPKNRFFSDENDTVGEQCRAYKTPSQALERFVKTLRER